MIFQIDTVIEKTNWLTWKTPRNNEKKFWDQNKEKDGCIMFPWSNLLILKQYNDNTLADLLNRLINHYLLNNENIKRDDLFTYCEFEKYFIALIPFYKRLGIKTIYISDLNLDNRIINGMHIKFVPKKTLKIN